MPFLPRLLLAAAVILAAAGVGVAVAQPGSLGGDDEDAAGPAVTTPADDPGDVAPDPDPSGAAEGDDRGEDGADTMPAPAEPTADDDVVADQGGAAPDQRGGSGLGDGPGTPRDLEDGLAATGGTSLLAAALAMAAAGLALPRRRV